MRCYSFSAGRWDIRLSCRRHKLSRGIILLHNNAHPYTARQTQALLREQFHWDIEHPPYSPDLAPSNFFLFPKMKEHVAGKCFANDDDLKDAGWITRRPHGMKKLYTNWCQGTTIALMLTLYSRSRDSSASVARYGRRLCRLAGDHALACCIQYTLLCIASSNTYTKFSGTTILMSTNACALANLWLANLNRNCVMYPSAIGAKFLWHMHLPSTVTTLRCRVLLLL